MNSFHRHWFSSTRLPREIRTYADLLNGFDEMLLQIILHEVKSGNYITHVWKNDDRVEVNLAKPFRLAHEGASLSKTVFNGTHDFFVMYINIARPDHAVVAPNARSNT